MDKDLKSGKKHYLNKQGHKEVLAATLSHPLEDFNRLEPAGSTLKDIVDNLAKIHNKTLSIYDCRSEEDNFIRRKGEIISGAMTRATTLLHKLRPMTTGANIINYRYFPVFTTLSCAVKKIYKFTDKSTDIHNLCVLKKVLNYLITLAPEGGWSEKVLMYY
jgi:hypothetical protein